MATSPPIPGETPAHKTATGFPSPADDFVESGLDLNQLLVRNKSATFFMRVQGNAMRGAGIHDGDVLVVDRSIAPYERAVVVAVVEGELMVRRLITRHGAPELHAENPACLPFCLKEGQELDIWGVVTSALHQVK
jgi:DNA polymerase V